MAQRVNALANTYLQNAAYTNARPDLSTSVARWLKDGTRGGTLGWTAKFNALMRNGYAKQIISEAGLLGYWRMNAAAGTTETDRSGNSHDGTHTGTFTLNQGGAIADGGAAVQYSASNGYLALGSVAALRPTATFSIEAWINLNPTVFPDGATNWILYDWQVFNASGTIFRVDGGTGKLQAVTNQAGANTSAFNTTALTKNAWYHVVFTFDGTTGRFYLNGVADGNAAFTAPVLAANNVFISRDSQGFVGSMDEVAIYSVVLTPAQVLAHYSLA